MRRRVFLKNATLGSIATLAGTATGAGVSAAPVSPTHSRPPLPQPVSGSSTRLKAVRFRVDVTPPIGERIAYSLIEKPGDPIYVSGIILDDGGTKAAWISCDFIYIRGEAVNRWKTAIAQVIGCPPENVMLHSVHQHDAPLILPEQFDGPGERSLTAKTMTSASKAYCDRTVASVCDAVSEAVKGVWTPIVRIATAEQRVSGLGAARRLVDESGVCVGVRWSRCSNEQHRSWPVGEIDTLVRTICFEGPGGAKFVALHFYATHPMAAYLRKKVGPDVPGAAIQFAQKKTPELMHIYFTGCGGNVTFGKYNSTGDQVAIDSLGQRLGQAFLTNLDCLVERKIGPIRFVRSTLDVPFDMARLENANPDNRDYTKRTLDLWKKATVTRFSLGNDVHVLSIGMGEVCVEYQLYAQSLVPDQFLATAAYVNGVYEYTPVAKAFPEGGYESSARACPVKPEIEQRLKAAIGETLADLR